MTHGRKSVRILRALMLVVVGVLVVLHGFAPKLFVIDAVTVGLLAVALILVFLPLIRSATLPDGTRIELADDLVRLSDYTTKTIEEEPAPGEPAASAAPITDPAPVAVDPEPIVFAAALTDEHSTNRAIDRILREARTSPRLGLIDVGVELERSIREVLAAWGGNRLPKGRTLRAGIDTLVEMGQLTTSIASGLDLFYKVRNEIVHFSAGSPVSDADVFVALDAGLSLLKAVAAIPRETHVIMRTNIPLFQDAAGTLPLQDASGVMVRTYNPSGTEYRDQVFPTTKTHFVVGKIVAWDWGTRSWGPAWYIGSGEPTPVQAWSGAAEFVGTHFD